MSEDEGIIVLRPAIAEDAACLYDWRNAEETRRLSFDPSPLRKEAHERWLLETLARADRHLLIGETANLPVGVLRFDLSGDMAIVSVYLVPGQSGKGLGTALLKEGASWARNALPQVRKLHARIHPENIPSQKAFAKVGFKEISRIFEMSLI